MSTTKTAIAESLNTIETQLQDTKDSMVGTRSVVSDTLKVVIPMLEDQLKVIRQMLELIE